MSLTSGNLLTAFAALGSMRAEVLRNAEKLRPVRGDFCLRLFQIHSALLHPVGQIVFDRILLFEVALRESDLIRTTLRPDVVESIGSAKFERNKMVQLANL